MSICYLNQAFALDCKTSKGGIKKVYFAQFPANGLSYSPTIASGVITGWAGGAAQFYTYNVRASTVVASDKGTISKANGTTFFASSLKLKLEKLSGASNYELLNLIQNRLLVIVLDRNGKYFLMGYNNGCDVTEIDSQFGTAMGDFNGYEISVSSEEETQMYEITSGIVAALIAA